MRLLVVAAAIAAICAGPAGAQSRPPNQPSLTVHGQGRVDVPPDRANLTVQVVTSGKSLEAATAAHRGRTERATKVLNDLNGNGLKIEQSTFQLNETHPPAPPGVPQSQSKTEYQATTTFQLSLTRLDQVDATVTAIAASGLFEVRNISFSVGNRDPGLRMARKKAVEDARERAATYAEAAGVQLRDILRIEDGDSHVPVEFAAPASVMRSVKVIPPEALTISAAVTITWSIDRRP